MYVYVETSALAKRYATEEYSESTRDAIASWVAGGHVLLSSALSWVEISRFARRAIPDDIAAVERDCLAGVAEVELRHAVLATARRIGPPLLRSLDALHLASAIVTSCDLVVTFDDRLAAACRDYGLQLWQPPSP